MILYEIAYPTEDGDVTEILTREEVLAEYWDYWRERMESVGKFDLITVENCLEDWCMLHWAAIIRIPI